MGQHSNEPQTPAWRQALSRVRGLLASPDEAPSAAANDGLAGLNASYASEDDAANAFALFSDWLTRFHAASGVYGATTPLISDEDPRITGFDRIVPVAGKRILELGALEGGHSKQLVDLGASDVFAIEANPRDYLKCLLMKEVLAVPRLQFAFGDFNAILTRKLKNSETFDVCVAVGVLYHMMDPVHTIELITSIAPVTYVWSHVASEQRPTGAYTTVTDKAGRNYRGKLNHYPAGRTLGGLAASAVWLEESAMMRAFEHCGHEVTMLERGAHPNGDMVLFVSQRKT